MYSLGYRLVEPKVLYFDNIMTKLIVNNRTDVSKTDINLLNYNVLYYAFISSKMKVANHSETSLELKD